MDIVERLQSRGAYVDGEWHDDLIREAADTIQQQAERIRELEIALEDSTVAIGQIAYLKQQLSEVVEYAASPRAALKASVAGMTVRPHSALALPLPKAMQPTQPENKP